MKKLDYYTTQMIDLQVKEDGEAFRNSTVKYNYRLTFNAFVSGLKDRQLAKSIHVLGITTYPEAVKAAERATTSENQFKLVSHTSYI